MLPLVLPGLPLTTSRQYLTLVRASALYSQAPVTMKPLVENAPASARDKRHVSCARRIVRSKEGNGKEKTWWKRVGGDFDGRGRGGKAERGRGDKLAVIDT
ncbi:unnamed protein product [Closterium sp. Naga37s-1]|nr:unnamed protein product [Closterium sp. Naga37s-1]